MQLTLEFSTSRELTQAEWDAIHARHTERLKRAPALTKRLLAEWQRLFPQFAHLSLRDMLAYRFQYEFGIATRVTPHRAPIYLEECQALQRLLVTCDKKFIRFLAKEVKND